MNFDHGVQATLSAWLRLLWGVAPSLRFIGDTPFIAGGAIHLPERGHWSEHRAAAAHAAAHLVFSPASVDAGGLGPIARHLLALLEDARVESLAMRELPGLARLWRPLHTATPAAGSDFESLMARLSHALIDPAYDDPDPWVRKGRRLFYLDTDLSIPGLRTIAELRDAASRLGNDIGQMRMQFNVRTHVPAPAYRDDHRWMWPTETLTAAPPPTPVAAQTLIDDDQVDALPDPSIRRYPEWDHLISRLRPDWCQVIEQHAAATASGGVDADAVAIGRSLLPQMRNLSRGNPRLRRSEQGETFDLDALVNWRLARRLGQSANPRVYRNRQSQTGRAMVWLLVDQSASTALPNGTGGGSRTVLDAALTSAVGAVLALQAAGIEFAVAGFSSNGRHEVRLRSVKDFAMPVDAAMLARLRGLKPGGSTRIGAAVRHAADRLALHRGRVRWLLLLSDGQAHDIDVHDTRYLVEDARHAVREARRRAVRSACLVFSTQVDNDARRIFGSQGVQPVPQAEHLPKAIQRLLA